jgi:curved DNA-binding protein CbpA
MGNHQSNSHQLTPEQYQQYQYFLQQQQRQQHQTNRSQQPMTNMPPQQMSNRQPQQMHNRPPQQAPNIQPTNVSQTQQTNRGVQNTFNHLQQQRTQVRVQNQNIDVKLIPNLQQKSKMPSVENSLQTAYDQRMFDNFNSMGHSQKTSVNGFKEIPNYKRQDTINPRQETINPRQEQYLEKEHLQEQEFIRNQQEQQEMAYRKYKAEQDAKRRGFFNNLNNEIDEIEQLKYNPEQILGLTEGIDYSELEIKKAYRNLALKYHPDKGGSEEVFKILTKAYMYLLKKAQGSNYVEKNFMDLKGNYERDGGVGGGGGTNSDDFNVKNFNKLFEDNKLENEEWDNGYGDWKTDDVSDTPKKIFNQKFTADIFNQVFNELKHNNTTNQEVIVYEDPKPLTVSNRFGFSDVDYKQTGDYSKEYDIQDGNSRQGIYYMDYKRAYTETTLISPNVVKSRKEFKDIEDAQVAREKQDFTMTEEERAYYEEKKRKEEEFELQRLDRLRKRDDQVEQHSNQVNRLLLGGNPKATRSLEYQRK